MVNPLLVHVHLSIGPSSPPDPHFSFITIPHTDSLTDTLHWLISSFFVCYSALSVVAGSALFHSTLSIINYNYRVRRVRSTTT